jgi:hypothetical protein
VAFAAVVVLEKLVVYCGGVYAGGEEISSVLEETTSVELGASVEDSGASEGAPDEDATSDVESAALLERSMLDEGKLEGALEGGRLEGALEGGKLEGALEEGRLEGVLEGAKLEDRLEGAKLEDRLEGGKLEGAGVSLLDPGVLDWDGDSLLEGSIEELGGLPELLEGGATTVVGSADEVTTVGERVTVGLSTDIIVDRGGAGAVETIVVGAACDSVDVRMTERAGIFLVVVSNESRDATEVTVPTVVDGSSGLFPTIGSQAPVLMDWPSCSVTVGFEFR